MVVPAENQFVPVASTPAIRLPEATLSELPYLSKVDPSDVLSQLAVSKAAHGWTRVVSVISTKREPVESSGALGKTPRQRSVKLNFSVAGEQIEVQGVGKNGRAARRSASISGLRLLLSKGLVASDEVKTLAAQLARNNNSRVRQRSKSGRGTEISPEELRSRNAAYQKLLSKLIEFSEPELIQLVKKLAGTSELVYQQRVSLNTDARLEWVARLAVPWKGKTLVSDWGLGNPAEAARRAAAAKMIIELVKARKVSPSAIEGLGQSIKSWSDVLPESIQSARQLLRNLHSLAPAWGKAQFEMLQLRSQGPNHIAARAGIKLNGQLFQSPHFFAAKGDVAREGAARTLLSELLRLGELSSDLNWLRSSSQETSGLRTTQQEVEVVRTGHSKKHSRYWEIDLISRLSAWSLSTSIILPNTESERFAVELKLVIDKQTFTAIGRSDSGPLNARGEAANALYQALQAEIGPIRNLFHPEGVTALRAICRLLKTSAPQYLKQIVESSRAQREFLFGQIDLGSGVVAAASAIYYPGISIHEVAMDLRSILLLYFEAEIRNLSPHS